MIVQTIEYCGIEPLAASINPQNDHWALRDYASRLLGITTRSVRRGQWEEVSEKRSVGGNGC